MCLNYKSVSENLELLYYSCCFLFLSQRKANLTCHSSNDARVLLEKHEGSVSALRWVSARPNLQMGRLL